MRPEFRTLSFQTAGNPVHYQMILYDCQASREPVAGRRIKIIRFLMGLRRPEWLAAQRRIVKPCHAEETKNL